MTYGNRKGERDPAINADKEPKQAEDCDYHTTILRSG